MARGTAETAGRKAAMTAAVLAELAAATAPVPTPRLLEAVRARVVLAGGTIGLSPSQRLWNVLSDLEAAGRVRRVERRVRPGTTWEACDGRG